MNAIAKATESLKQQEKIARLTSELQIAKDNLKMAKSEMERIQTDLRDSVLAESASEKKK